MKKVFCMMIIISILGTVVYAQNNDIAYETLDSHDGEYFYAIKTDGSVYKLQYYNNYGIVSSEYQIEIKDMQPTAITDDAISVTRGYVLKEDNSVWKTNDETNEYVRYMDVVKEVSGTYNSALFVKQDNTLWGVGDNSRGELAQGEMDKSLEQQIEEDLRHKNKTQCTPELFETPVKIMDDVQSAVIHGDHSIVLKTDGTVWTFGCGHTGQLGIGYAYIVNNEPTQILSNVKKIFASGDAVFALDNFDVLWRWGSNYITYAGGGCTVTPEKYVEDVISVTNMPGYNLVVKTDNSLWIYGDTSNDGGRISKEPLKICDNVVYVKGLEDYTNERDRILVLKENKDLMLLTIPREDEFSCSIEKIMGNVRLPNETSVKKDFEDISDKSEEVQGAIMSLAKAGIITGTSETEFSPDKPITRAEIAALILRMTAKDDKGDNGGFSDVTEDKWYYDTAGASKKYGFVQGFEDNTFRGDEVISKVQLVSLVARVLRKESAFIDEETSSKEYQNIPAWAVEDIALAEQEELISVEKDLSSPDGYMTRGEAAVILYRLYNNI